MKRYTKGSLSILLVIAMLIGFVVPVVSAHYDAENEYEQIIPFGTTVTVNFLGNGGTVAADQAQRTLAIDTALGAQFPTMTPIRNDFVFRHWNTVQGLTAADPGTVFTNATIVSDDMDVFAQWGREVTFNVNAIDIPPAQQYIPARVVAEGFSVANMPVTPGAPVVTWPTPPNRVGYIFVGWYTTWQNTGGTLYTENSVINGPRALYARWTPSPIYQVHFNLDGGTLGPSHVPMRYVRAGTSIAQSWDAPISLNQGVLWPRSAPLATRETTNLTNGNVGSLNPYNPFDNQNFGLVLTGWFFDPHVSIGSRFAPPGSTATASFSNAIVDSTMVDAFGHLNVYARWVYRVTFNTNAPVNAATITGGATRDIAVTPGTLAGGTIVDNGTVLSTAGTPAGSAVAATTMPTAIRQGFTFVGWYNIQLPYNVTDAEVIALGGRRLNDDCVINTSGQVWARWNVENEATVNFNLNGGSWIASSNEVGYRVVPPTSNIHARWGTAGTPVPAVHPVAGPVNLPSMPRHPTRDNYVFTGWFIVDPLDPQPLPDAISTGDAALRTSTGAGGRRFNGASHVPAAGLTVYARWLPYHTVTFNANGGTRTGALLTTHGYTRRVPQGWSMDDMNIIFGGVEHGSPVNSFHSVTQIRLAATRTNHTSFGWNTEADGTGNAFATTTVVTDNIEVFAMWAPTITFNNNHESVGNPPNVETTRNVLYGRTLANHHLHPNTAAAALTMPTIVNWPQLNVANRALIGWNTAPDGTGEWFNENTLVYEAPNSSNPFASGPFTVYAIWSVGVAFNPGAAPADAIQDVDREREVNFALPWPGNTIGASPGGWPDDPVWPDHTFRGWNTSPLGDLTWVGPNTEIPGPQTLYAMWEANVTFDPNGGTLVGQAVHTRNIGETIGVGNMPTATRTNFTFAGWLCPDGQPFDANTTIPHSMTVTAQWTGNPVQVTFNANHGVTPATSVQTIAFGATYAAAMGHADVVALETRSGFTFGGWFSSQVYANGTGQTGRVYPTTEVTNAADHMLYARWTPIGGGGYDNGGNGGNGGDFDLPDPDVPLDPFVEDHIWYVRGFPDGSFRPEAPITRAEIAMIVFRLIDSGTKYLPQVGGQFNDVNINSWYGHAVSYLANRDIVFGYPDGTFRPNAPITRAELTAVMSRFFEIVDNGVNNFIDVEGNHWAIRYINNAHNRGWIIGFGDGTFRPNNATTRAEAVTLLNRILERRPDPQSVRDTLYPHLAENFDMHAGLFNDITNSHWAYYDVMEAAVEHEFEWNENDLEYWSELYIPWLKGLVAFNH